MVHITEEDPEGDLFYLKRPYLQSFIASEVVPLEEGVDRFRDKEDEETPLPILPSGIKVYKYSIIFNVTANDFLHILYLP